MADGQELRRVCVLVLRRIHLFISSQNIAVALTHSHFVCLFLSSRSGVHFLPMCRRVEMLCEEDRPSTLPSQRYRSRMWAGTVRVSLLLRLYFFI